MHKPTPGEIDKIAAGLGQPPDSEAGILARQTLFKYKFIPKPEESSGPKKKKPGPKAFRSTNVTEERNNNRIRYIRLILPQRYDSLGNNAILAIVTQIAKWYRLRCSTGHFFSDVEIGLIRSYGNAYRRVQFLDEYQKLAKHFTSTGIYTLPAADIDDCLYRLVRSVAPDRRGQTWKKIVEVAARASAVLAEKSEPEILEELAKQFSLAPAGSSANNLTAVTAPFLSDLSPQKATSTMLIQKSLALMIRVRELLTEGMYLRQTRVQSALHDSVRQVMTVYDAPAPFIVSVLETILTGAAQRRPSSTYLDEVFRDRADIGLIPVTLTGQFTPPPDRESGSRRQKTDKARKKPKAPET